MTGEQPTSSASGSLCVVELQGKGRLAAVHWSGEIAELSHAGILPPQLKAIELRASALREQLRYAQPQATRSGMSISAGVSDPCMPIRVYSRGKALVMTAQSPRRATSTCPQRSRS